MNHTVIPRVAVLAPNCIAKSAVWFSLNDHDMVLVKPFESYLYFKRWCFKADDSSKIINQIWFGPQYSYGSMSYMATQLANEFDWLNNVDYFRLVNKDGFLDLKHPIKLDYTWTLDHVVKFKSPLKPSLYGCNKNNLICHSLL